MRLPVIAFASLLSCANPLAPKSKRKDVATTHVPNVVSADALGQDAGSTSAGGAITVTLVGRSGAATKGVLTLNANGDHLLLAGTITGLTPGAKHALHIQTEGSCEAADGSSAGADFHPELPAGSDPAFAPNPAIAIMTGGGDGHADLKVNIQGFSLTLGQPANILSRSLVVYEKDGSIATGLGQRWACGRIDAGSVATPDRPTIYQAQMVGDKISGELELRQAEDGIAVSGVLGGAAANTPIAVELRTNPSAGPCTGDYSSVGDVLSPFPLAPTPAAATAPLFGELGTVQSDGSGKLTIKLTLAAGTLTGATGVVGRAVVLHAVGAPTPLLACGVVK